MYGQAIRQAVLLNRLKVVLAEHGKTNKWLAEKLSKNKAMANAIREHFHNNLPILAECGRSCWVCGFAVLELE